jgi:hypothetical protein
VTLTGAWPYDEPPDCSFEAPRVSAGDAFRAIAMDDQEQRGARVAAPQPRYRNEAKGAATTTSAEWC